MKIGRIKPKNHLIDDRADIDRWCKLYIKGNSASVQMSYEITPSGHVVLNGPADVYLSAESTSSIVPVIFDSAENASFGVSNRYLTNLTGLPEEIVSLNISLNHMKNLKTIPKIIKKDLNLSHSNVESFEYVPQKVFGTINLQGVKIVRDLKNLAMIEGVTDIIGNAKWVPIFRQYCGPGKDMPSHIYDIGSALYEAGFDEIV